jgi:hypothetical protein
VTSERAQRSSSPPSAVPSRMSLGQLDSVGVVRPLDGGFEDARAFELSDLRMRLLADVQSPCRTFPWLR